MKKAKKILTLGILCCMFPFLGHAITWTSSQQISTPSVDASDPTIGIDKSGNAIAAWIENGIVVTSIFSGTWSAPSTLSASGASAPQIAVDDNGNASLIWLQGTTVYASSMPFNGSWSVPASISAAGASSPAIAIDRASGNAAATWLLSGIVQASTKPQLGSWTVAQAISSSTGIAPSISISGVFATNQQVFAVWHAPDPVTQINTAYGAGLLIGNSWTSAQAISDGTYNVVLPKVGVDLIGNIHVAWFRYVPDGSFFNDVFVEVVSQTQVQPLSGVWTTPVALSSAGLVDPAFLALQVKTDMNHTVVVGWTNSNDGATYKAAISTKLFDQDWSRRIEYVNRDLFAYSFDLADNASGQVFAVYMGEDSSNNPQIYARETEIFTGFPRWNSVITQLSTGTNNGFPKAVSSYGGSSTTYGAAVWLQFISPTLTLQAVTGSGPLLSAPGSFAASQPLGVDYGSFTVHTNTLTWTASPSAVNYFIYRNGELIGSVLATDPLTFTDPNQPQQGSPQVTYGISAIDANGAESLINTITF